MAHSMPSLSLSLSLSLSESSCRSCWCCCCCCCCCYCWCWWWWWWCCCCCCFRPENPAKQKKIKGWQGEGDWMTKKIHQRRINAEVAHHRMMDAIEREKKNASHRPPFLVFHFRLVVLPGPSSLWTCLCHSTRKESSSILPSWSANHLRRRVWLLNQHSISNCIFVWFDGIRNGFLLVCWSNAFDVLD